MRFSAGFRQSCSDHFWTGHAEVTKGCSRPNRSIVPPIGKGVERNDGKEGQRTSLRSADRSSGTARQPYGFLAFAARVPCVGTVGTAEWNAPDRECRPFHSCKGLN